MEKIDKLFKKWEQKLEDIHDIRENTTSDVYNELIGMLNIMSEIECEYWSYSQFEIELLEFVNNYFNLLKENKI